jgi:PAS domain S-box-containing protein
MAASRALNDQFRMLFEASPNGIIAFDAAGCIILLNAQVEKMFGYSREELIGQPAEVLVPVRFRRRHSGLRKEFAAAPQLRLMGTGRDLIGMRKNGTEFAVEIGLNPAVTSMGDIAIATVVDITERKLAAEKKNVHEHERENIQLFQLLGMPAAVLQHDGQVLHVNPLFKQLHLNPLFKEIHSQFKFLGDRVEFANSTTNEFFKRELACLDRRSGDKFVGPARVLTVDGYPPLVFHLLPMKGSFGSTLGILVLTRLGATGVPSSDLVQRLFALAPAEARVAALIGSGLSPRQAAEKLSISEGNVRTTLKHVFTKVGVSRQSELAVLLTKFALR